MASSYTSLLRQPAAALDTAISSALFCSRAAEFLFAGHGFSHFYSQEKLREQWDYETQQKWVFFHQQPLGDRDFAPRCGGIGPGSSQAGTEMLWQEQGSPPLTCAV